MNTTPAKLVADIEAYCQAAGWTEVRFGKHVMGSTYWVQRLREGKVTLTSCSRAQAYMAAHPAAKEHAA